MGITFCAFLYLCNTLTYGQTEILLFFGKVIGEADVRDVQEMTASNVGLRMMAEEAALKEMPLTQNFIRRDYFVKVKSSSFTLFPNTGCTTSGAISAKGRRTKSRRCISG